MRSTASVARRYARALFDLAQERNQVEAMGQELERVVETMRDRRDLRALWEHREVAPRLKRALVAQHFAEQVSDLVRNLLYLLVAKRRESYLFAIQEQYVALADAALNRVEVEVRSAAPLAEDVLARLEARLSDRLGKKIKFAQRVEPALLGGMVVRVGDVLMDGSVQSQLTRMRRRLAGTGSNG